MEANKVNLEILNLVKWYFKVHGKATNYELKELGAEYPYSYVTKLINEGMSIESKVEKEANNPCWVYMTR